MNADDALGIRREGTCAAWFAVCPVDGCMHGLSTDTDYDRVRAAMIRHLDWHDARGERP